MNAPIDATLQNLYDWIARQREREKISKAMRAASLIAIPCLFNQEALDICAAVFKCLEKRLIASVDRDGLAVMKSIEED